MNDSDKSRLAPRVCSLLSMFLVLVSGCAKGGDVSEDMPLSELPPDPIWRLEDVPVYSVTQSAQDPSFTLHGVWSGHLLEDGSAVISNSSSRQLVYFDTIGHARIVAGGSGQGPGEFNGQIGRIFEAENGLGVWDSAARRISYFSRDGDYLSNTSLPRTPVRTVVGYIPGRGVITAPHNVPQGQARSYEYWSATGDLSSTLSGPLEPPSLQITWSAVPTQDEVELFGLDPQREMSHTTALPYGCGATSAEAVVGSSLLAMDSFNGTVRSYSVDGGSQVLYQPLSRSIISDQLFSEIRRDFHESDRMSTVPPDTIDAVLERTLGVGSALPAWTGILGDPSGRVWLRTEECSADPLDDFEFEIVDMQGERLARIVVPRAWRLLAVREDRLLVVRLDSLGVEHLELYRIQS